MVQLAELMVELSDFATWAQFQKNGTDATTTAATLYLALVAR